jgi:hypothetical protein
MGCLGLEADDPPEQGGHAAGPRSLPDSLVCKRAGKLGR